MKDITGIPVSLWYNKSLKEGEVVAKVGTVEETIKVKDWNSVKYLFWYTDNTIDKSQYMKDIINPFLSHDKDDQLAQSKFHFGKRAVTARQFIFRVRSDGFLWCQMTTAWKPLTIDQIRGILPVTAWETTTVPASDEHGGKITYNMMYPDGVTAIIDIDAGILNGRNAMNIKGKLIGELGEITVDKKLRYRHTDTGKISEGLTEMFESMGRLHDTLPDLINIEFNQDMLGEYKNKLGKELRSKLTNSITVYHAIAILRDAGKKAVAGTVLLNSIKEKPVIVIPAPVVELTPQVIEPIPEAQSTEPEIVATPIPE